MQMAIVRFDLVIACGTVTGQYSILSITGTLDDWDSY